MVQLISFYKFRSRPYHQPLALLDTLNPNFNIVQELSSPFNLIAILSDLTLDSLELVNERCASPSSFETCSVRIMFQCFSRVCTTFSAMARENKDSRPRNLIISFLVRYSPDLVLADNSWEHGKYTLELLLILARIPLLTVLCFG